MPTVDPRLLLLTSPALPVGGYSFSHGLESAVTAGLISDFAAAQAWIDSLAQHVLPTLELPLLLRLMRAVQAQDAIESQRWNDLLLAMKESAELLHEEESKGAALARLYPIFDVEPQVAFETPSFAAAFASICVSWRIAPANALTAYAWAFYEMLVAAAVKLVPLGHSDGQRLLFAFAGDVSDLVRSALQCADADLGAGTPGLAILSSTHECQQARVFRS